VTLACLTERSRLDEPNGERLRSCPAPASLPCLALVMISTPELRVRVYMNSRQSYFKPDPVCALNSARKDFAVDCGYVVGWYVIFVVDGFVDA
jgi:hypothetical protein